MMNNSRIRQNVGSNVMPLLMYYTPSTRIEEMDEVKISYNDLLQITEIEARVVGTRSLKVCTTKKKTGKNAFTRFTDQKNEIDDEKVVR